MSANDSYSWKNILEEKPEFVKEVILSDGMHRSIIGSFRVDYKKFHDCEGMEIDRDEIESMVFWRYLDKPKPSWKASNGLYYPLMEMELGAGDVCPLCGGNLSGVTDSSGNNCKICVGCSVGEVSSWGFYGWKNREKGELEENDKILDEIEGSIEDIYSENPISESDFAILSKIRATTEGKVVPLRTEDIASDPAW